MFGGQQLTSSTDHMSEPSILLEKRLSAIVDSEAPLVPFYSTVFEDQVHKAGSLDATYWRSNMRSPVLFSSTLTKLLHERPASSNIVLLEVGPHSALAGPIRQILKSTETTSARYTSTLARNMNERDALLATAGKLFTYGVPIRLEALSPTGQVTPLVPQYPWYRDAKYWRMYPLQVLFSLKLPRSFSKPWALLLHSARQRASALHKYDSQVEADANISDHSR